MAKIYLDQFITYIEKFFFEDLERSHCTILKQYILIPRPYFVIKKLK